MARPIRSCVETSKNSYMKLIYIKSTMEPKDYSNIRIILKKAQGEKIAPHVFKIFDTKAIKEYLDKERITYEIYLEEPKEITKKRLFSEVCQESKKRRKMLED
jgi:hypothetical protein